MKKNSTSFAEKKEALFGRDELTEGLLGKIREMIVTLVDAELNAVLGAVRYERSPARRGYRNGPKVRSLTTGLGRTTVDLPRGRLHQGDGDVEWESHLIRRYQRRSGSVDAALLGTYLSGANTRRIKGALSPLLRGAPGSISAISRVVGRLSALFETWRKRELNGSR